MNLYDKVFKRLVIICLLAFLVVMSCLSSSVLLDKSIAFKFTYFTILVLSLVRPGWAIVVFVALMPFLGGSQPGYEHTVRFYQLYTGLGIGLGVQLCREIWLTRAEAGEVIKLSNPVFFSMVVYWVVTGMSLGAVPYGSMLKSLVTFNPLLAQQFLGQYETSPLYPWLSFMVLSITFIIFAYMSWWFVRVPHAASRVLGGLCIGMVLTVSLGLLEYYRLISLVVIRPDNFDAIYGSTYKYVHLTSLFGNPGWLSQYLTLVAPAILVVLVTNLRKQIKISVIVCLMLLAEWCVLLAYQRGGWVSYPLTALIIWFCIYVLLDKSTSFSIRKKLRSSVVKIIITAPLTILLSMAAVSWLAQLQPGVRQNVDGFVKRAASISNVNDRLAFWEPARKILAQHPILGGGVDSFQYQYDKSFIFEGHKCDFVDAYTGGAHGSAHNLYFQTLAGKGLVGLFSLLSVIVAGVIIVWRGVFSQPIREELARSGEQKILLMSGLAFLGALVIYGNVGEIFYFPMSYMVFGVFMAILAGCGEGLVYVSEKTRRLVVSLLIVSFVLHLALENFARMQCY